MAGHVRRHRDAQGALNANKPGLPLQSRDGELEIGSIGIPHGDVWIWGIDTVIPVRTLETQCEGKDRVDCMRQFTAAWERFAADEANLTEFLNMKRQRR